MITLRARLDSVSNAYNDSVNALRLFVDEMRRQDLERPELRFLQLLLEMSFIYRVALFDAFLAKVLQAVLVSRPEMFHRDNKLTHEQILGCPDMPAMIALMAHKELQRIDYQSVDEPQAWVRLHLGIELFPSSEVRTRMVELTARRHSYVHARDAVNDRFPVTDQFWSVSDGALQTVEAHLLQEIYRKFCSARPRAV